MSSARTPPFEASRPAPANTETARSFSRREWIGAVGGFTLLTLVLTYPQVQQMASAMGQHYDSLFSTWRLAWIAHQLPRDPLHLFDANIFHPEPGALSYSDAMLLPGLLGAPLIWMGVHPIVVYNLLVLGFVCRVRRVDVLPGADGDRVRAGGMVRGGGVCVSAVPLRALLPSRAALGMADSARLLGAHSRPGPPPACGTGSCSARWWSCRCCRVSTTPSSSPPRSRC